MKKIKKIFVSILFGKKESPALQGNACGARVIRIDREAPRRSEQAEKPLRAAAVAAERGVFPEEFALRAAAGEKLARRAVSVQDANAFSDALDEMIAGLSSLRGLNTTERELIGSAHRLFS